MTNVALQPKTIDAEREAIRQELVRLADGHGGYLSPDTVVEAAADPASVLHDRFTWDDTEAARRFRLVQAGMMLRQIRVTIMRPALAAETPGTHVIEVRQFQSDPNARGNGNGSYARVEALIGDEEKRKSLLESVVGELRGIRKRYDELTELTGVWMAVDGLAI
jgi:hypothetical protein